MQGNESDLRMVILCGDGEKKGRVRRGISFRKFKGLSVKERELCGKHCKC